MSRSDYSEDCDDQWQSIMWRGAVSSAIRGKRGQQFFRDLLAALDALPEKKLIAGELQARDGCVCALGALGRARGIDVSKLDPENSRSVASKFGIADALAREVVHENDEGGWYSETPEHRFGRIRGWASSQIKPEKQAAA